MKNIYNLLFLLITVLQINNVMAAENITGTWQGKLVISPGNEMIVQFIIEEGANGSYSVTLNSPDQGTIKNVKADSVAYSSGVLKVNVAELSGSYEGVVKDGKIEGIWKQEGTSFPLILRPDVKTELSKKVKEILLGTWQGKPSVPQGAIVIGEIPTYIFRFEMSKKGEFTGIMTIPDTGSPDMPVTDMGISDGKFTFKTRILGIQSEFKGKITDKEIVGEFKNPDAPGSSITLKKVEYKAKIYKLTLPEETMDQLLGEWNGTVTIQAIQTLTLAMVFRFEMTGNGDFLGFMDYPEQGERGVPITDANITNGELTLKMAGIGSELKGRISAGKIVGDWTVAGANSAPLTLKKGKYVAPVYKLSLPKETMDQLSGKWNGKLDDLDVIFRFEKVKSGDFIGFVDMPDLGAKDMPVTEANLSDGKLSLKIKAAMADEFKGQLSGDQLVGEWKPALRNSSPLTLTKEKP